MGNTQKCMEQAVLFALYVEEAVMQAIRVENLSKKDADGNYLS